jgi:hypothetical protein
MYYSRARKWEILLKRSIDSFRSWRSDASSRSSWPHPRLRERLDANVLIWDSSGLYLWRRLLTNPMTAPASCKPADCQNANQLLTPGTIALPLSIKQGEWGGSPSVHVRVPVLCPYLLPSSSDSRYDCFAQNKNDETDILPCHRISSRLAFAVTQRAIQKISNSWRKNTANVCVW